MQFDQSQIAIHERGWLDNLDLALHFMRSHAAGVAASALAGIVPLAIVNFFLIDWPSAMPAFNPGFWNAYYLTTLLVMIEAPIATAPLTLYLGQALFLQQTDRRRIARDFWQCLPQLLLLQGLLRTVLIVPVITWIVPYVVWPYLNEVILLERNPLFAKKNQLSTMQRSSALHRGNGADFLLRAIGAAIFALLLIIALRGSLDYVWNNMLGLPDDWVFEGICAQVVLWLVTVYFTMARFLCYLDQRIRNEGWEVELLLRAQRERLTNLIA